MSDDSIKWPYMFRLTDGYESSMPTFKQAMAAMLYEMQEQQQPNGVITICCQTGESKKEMIVATVFNKSCSCRSYLTFRHR